MAADERMTIDERIQYLRMLYKRDERADRAERSRLLNEMETITAQHRKTLIRTMRGQPQRQGCSQSMAMTRSSCGYTSMSPVPAVLECYTMPTYRGPGTRMSSDRGSPRVKAASSRTCCPYRRDALRLNRMPGGRRGSIRVFEFDWWTAGMPAHDHGRCGRDRLRSSLAFGSNTRRLPGAFGTASELRCGRR